MSWVQLDQGEWLGMKDHEALFVSESHMFDTTLLNLKLLCSPVALMGKVLEMAAWKQLISSNMVINLLFETDLSLNSYFLYSRSTVFCLGSS